MGITYTGGVMKASDNALYGTANFGGIYSRGTIFKYDLSVNTYSTLYNFDSIHGKNPYFGTLVEATDDKLYGTTYLGGASGNGVIFSYDRTSNTYTDLYDFDGTHGSNPYSGLIQATDGKLYGMTYTGGSFNKGTIFSYDIPTAHYTLIHNFDGVNGSFPKGALFQASNGTLYGTTYYGGAYSDGTAFSYDITTSTYTVLASFDGTAGSYPQSDITEATVLTTDIASADVSSFSISPNPTSGELRITN
jgi:uncharacterized repeat protein (TIGR03803 family)